MDFLSVDFLVMLPIFVGLGCFVGFIAGLLGVGGGAVLVPVLYYLGQFFYSDQLPDEVLMHTALGTAMAIIIPTGLSSSRAQIRRGAVEWGAFRKLAIGLIAGVCLGIFVVSGLKSLQLQFIFSVGLYCLAAMIFFKKEEQVGKPILLKWYISNFTACLVGIFSTLVGIGGATLNVPYLSRAGLDLHRAIATSSVLGVVISIPAALGYILIGVPAEIAVSGFVGFVNVVAWGLIVPFSVLCAPLGVRASHALPVKQLKYVFALLLCLIASKMLYEALTSLMLVNIVEGVH